jgi:hypothetical protein
MGRAHLCRHAGVERLHRHLSRRQPGPLQHPPVHLRRRRRRRHRRRRRRAAALKFVTDSTPQSAQGEGPTGSLDRVPARSATAPPQPPARDSRRHPRAGRRPESGPARVITHDTVGLYADWVKAGVFNMSVALEFCW